MIQQVQLEDVKKGDFFRFKPQETAPLWVRDTYDRGSKTFIVYAYDDANRFLNRKRTVKVFIEVYCYDTRRISRLRRRERNPASPPGRSQENGTVVSSQPSVWGGYISTAQLQSLRDKLKQIAQ